MFDEAKPAHVHVHRIAREPGRALADSEGEFQRRYRPVDGELLLLRPDGYLAGRVPGSDEKALLAHLATFRPQGENL